MNARKFLSCSISSLPAITMSSAIPVTPSMLLKMASSLDWKMSWATFKFCSDFINRVCLIGLSLQCFIKIPRIQADPQFPLNGGIRAWWLPESFSTITWELTQSVYSVTSSRMPSSTKDLISSLKASSRWIGTFLGACLAGLCSGFK